MTTQPEALLENNLIKQLIDLGYTSVKIHDGNALVSNFKTQLEVNHTFKKGCYRRSLYECKKGNGYKKQNPEV